MIKPSAKEVEEIKDKVGVPKNYSEDHVLNTPHALRTVLYEEKKRESENATCVTACCFSHTQQTRCFFGFHDGLICFWNYNQDQSKVQSKAQKSLLGHTNKINHLTFEGGYLFSCSQDCTVR